jgi:hypothetical protein
MNAKWAAIVAVIVVIVAAVAGFGGYTAGKSAGVAQAAAIRNNFFAARGGGQGGQGGSGGQGARNFNPDNFATGQVKSISGDTIQLSTATDVLTVKLNDKTQIQKQAQGTVNDIQTGERLVIQGQRASDGTLTAQTIQIGRGPGPGGNGGSRGSNDNNGQTTASN